MSNRNYIFETYPDRIQAKEGQRTTVLEEYGLQCMDGWVPIINNIADKVAERDPEGRVRFVQIKEKLGGLRFYFDIENYNGRENEEDKKLWNDLFEITLAGEKLAEQTCEVCGEMGSRRTDLRWMKTLCDKHYGEVPDERKRR